MATISNITFVPTQFSGCALWLDAADSSTVIQSGGAVTAWNDKSGNGRNATASNSPKYSGSNIDIRNNGYLYGSISIASGALQTTAFTVAITPTTFTSVNRILSFNDSAGNDYNSPSGFVVSSTGTSGVGLAYRNVGAQTTGTLGTNTSFMCTTVAFSNGGFVFSYNGNYPSGASSNYASNTNVNNTNALTRYYAGVVGSSSNAFDTSQAWKGLMNEIIIFNRTLNQSEYQQVEGYLAWKWNIQAKLPTSHPYYNNPILTNTVLSTQLANPIYNQYASIFTPTQISGCALWLDSADAATVIQSGGTVSQWNDKSGNANHAKQTTASNQPTYTNTSSGIRFNPTNSGATQNTTQFLSNTAVSISLTAHAIFIVQSQSAATSNTPRAFAIGNGVADYQLSGILFGSLFSPYTTFLTYGLVSGNYGANLTTTTPWPLGVYADVFDTTTVAGTYTNGTRVANEGPNGGYTFSNAATYYYVGCGYNSGTTGFYNGTSYEIIVYSNLITPAQRQQVEGYLAWKWGLQGKLATSHPYYYNQAISNLILPRPLQNPFISIVSGFLPTQFSALGLWLDSSDLTTITVSGSNISQWTDKSSNANNATQATSSNQPFLTSAGILFNGSQNLNLANPNALASNTTFSAFFVEQRASSANTNYVLVGSATTVNQNLNIGYDSSTVFRFAYYGNDLNYTVPAYSAGSEPFRLWGAIQSSTGRSTYLNGTLGASDTNTTLLTSWNGGNIGKNPFGVGTFYYYGTIKEILFFKPSLGLSQQQQIEGYLAWKWGLQKNLPPLHPYVLFPPN